MASALTDDASLIRRVVIRNYKSIAACDVELGPLTFLVGPNGSGKSNFLDALRFVSDSLRQSLEHAFRDRGGVREVLHRSIRFSSFGIRLEFQLPTDEIGHFAFNIKVLKSGFTVQNEECSVTTRYGPRKQTHFYRVSEGTVVESSLPVPPAAVTDRFYLVNVSGYRAFRAVYDALSMMGFYNLNPDVMREPQRLDQGDFLVRDGANSHSVLANLQDTYPKLKSRIQEYLAQVVPGIHDVYTIPLGGHGILQFRQELLGSDGWVFQAVNMSDGTLRALGILIALFQKGAAQGEDGPPLVALEEPETALHPAATGVLIDAMRDAATMRQVIVTSHSPELLDNSSVASSEIVAVITEEEGTRIGHLDEAGRSVLRDHLFTAGDLLRMNQLRPDPAAGALNPDDLELFGTGAPA